MVQISYITESRPRLGMPKIPLSVFRTGRLTRVLFFGQILLEFRSAAGLTKTTFFLGRTQILLNRIAAAASFSSLRVKREWG